MDVKSKICHISGMVVLPEVEVLNRTKHVIEFGVHEDYPIELNDFIKGMNGDPLPVSIKLMQCLAIVAAHENKQIKADACSIHILKIAMIYILWATEHGHGGLYV